jgi:hypothetical protein
MARRRRMTRVERRAWSAAVMAASIAVLWQTHPALLVAALTLAATAAGLGLWARRAWLQRAGQPTVLYRHYFAAWVLAMFPGLSPQVYYGITSNYALRCAQHAESSAWWSLIDPQLSTCQTWPNRAAAERAERAAIRRDCPIGNQAHNPRYWAQEPERRRLWALAAQVVADQMIGDV